MKISRQWSKLGEQEPINEKELLEQITCYLFDHKL